MRRQPEYLFGSSERRVENALAGVTVNLERKVEQIDQDALLGADEDRLTKELVDEARLDPPVVDFDGRSALPPAETKRDVSDDPMRPIHDRSRPFHVGATVTTIVLPFTGDGGFFSFCPSRTIPTWLPVGRVVGQELHLPYEQTKPDPQRLASDYERDRGVIERFTDMIRSEVEAFNASLPAYVLGVIQRRKTRILDSRGVLATLNIPVRARPDAPATYAPSIRKKVSIEMQKKADGAFKPEPGLEKATFDQIVKVLHTMGVAIERSPSTFAELSEPDLRNLLLVLLNSHFEGEAMGEVFNAKGKTDILIRQRDRNLFIAECKKWDGPKSVTDALDQLLGYLCWRDTKAALLVFNHRQDLTAVLSKLDTAVRAHESFVSEQRRPGETEFRYMFRPKKDSERRIHLAVLVFDVPGPSR